jgi:hypothetical protein
MKELRTVKVQAALATSIDVRGGRTKLCPNFDLIWR